MGHYTHFLLNYFSKVRIILIFVPHYYTHTVSAHPYPAVIYYCRQVL